MTESELRSFVTFDAAIDDETVFDSRGDISTPAGRLVATAIAAELCRAGVDAGQPEQHSFYGWQLIARTSDGKFALTLQLAEHWLLIIDRESSIASMFSRKTRERGLRFMIELIERLPSSDSRFSNFAWFTRAEYERNESAGQGAP